MTHPLLDDVALVRLRRIGGDSLVTRMFDLFLSQGALRVAAIHAAAASNDAHGLEHAAHSLKSSAGNLGGTRLQYAAENLERIAAQGIVDASAAMQVSRDFEAMADALRRKLEEPAT